MCAYSLIVVIFKFKKCFLKSISYFQYKHTSLEGNYKHELHTEADLGLDIDLISMDCDNDAEVSNFNEVDEKLLEDEVSSK